MTIAPVRRRRAPPRAPLLVGTVDARPQHLQPRLALHRRARPRRRSRRGGARAPQASIGPSRRLSPAAPSRVLLLARPGLDRGVRLARVARRRLGARGRHRQLEADAVRIEEVDRLDDLVVGDAEHLDARRLEPRLRRRAARRSRVDAQGDVVDPRGRVRRGLGSDVVAEVEEREVRAVGHAKEDVHVRAVLAGARHDVGADHVHERQPEHVLVEGARLLAVAAAVGVMVQAADRHEGSAVAHRSGPAANARRQR